MNITEKAVAKLKEMIEETATPLKGVRVFTVQSCCGSSVQMSLIDQIVEGDTIIQIDNVDFYLDTESIEEINKIKIDFNDEHFVVEGSTHKGCC